MNTTDAAKKYLKAPRLPRHSPVTVLLLRANRDASGNPRRAFVVLHPQGGLVEVLAEGYGGDALLKARWPWFDHRACSRLDLEASYVVNIDVTVSELRRFWRRNAEIDGGLHDKYEGSMRGLYLLADRYQRYSDVVEALISIRRDGRPGLDQEGQPRSTIVYHRDDHVRRALRALSNAGVIDRIWTSEDGSYSRFKSTPKTPNI